MAKVSQPDFAAYNIPPRPVPAIPVPPQRFVPSATSPLDRVKRETASIVTVQSAEEQRRAEQIPAGIAAGDHAPRYGDRVDANPAPKAGGSKTR